MHKHIIILFLTCLFFTISYSNLWGAENTDTPKIFADQSGLFGATDASGKIIIPFKYQWVEQIEDLDNLYFVGVTSPTSRSSLGLDFGVMNDQGKLIVPIKYSVIIYDSFLKHRFKVFLDANVPSTKIGYLDENGKVIVPPIYDELRGISYKGSKPTYIGTLDGKYGYINVVTGKVMIPFEYEELKISSQETDEQGNGVVAARKKELYGLITTNNVEVCPFKYDFIDQEFTTKVGLAQTGGNFVSIDFKDNKCVETPLATVYSSNFVPRAAASINPKPFDGLYAAEDYPNMETVVKAYKSNILRWVAIPSLQINGNKAYVAFGQFPGFSQLLFNELDVVKQKDSFNLMVDVDDTGKKVSTKFLNFVEKNGLMFCDDCEAFNLPNRWRKVQAEKAPAFVGIGVAIQENKSEGKIQIKEVLEGSAADQAGLKAGDLITAIDGVETQGDDLAKATSKIRGEPGTQVKLKIVRNGKPLTAPVAVTRSLIKLN